MVKKALGLTCQLFNPRSGTTVFGYKGVVTIRNDGVQKKPISPDSVSAIQKEANILRYLTSTFSFSGLNKYIPEFYGFSPDDSCLYMSRIEGFVLGYCGDYDSFVSLNSGEQDNVATQVADFLVNMHNLNISDKHRAEWLATRDFLEPLRARQKIEEQSYYFSGFPDIKYCLDRATEYLVNCNNLSDKKSLVHRDLHANNILFNPSSSRIGIVDFDCSGFDYRHLDFMKIYNCFPPVMRDRIIDIYEGEMGDRVEREMAQAAGDLYKLFLFSSVDSRSPCINPVLFN